MFTGRKSGRALIGQIWSTPKNRAFRAELGQSTFSGTQPELSITSATRCNVRNVKSTQKGQKTFFANSGIFSRNRAFRAELGLCKNRSARPEFQSISIGLKPQSVISVFNSSIRVHCKVKKRGV